MAETVKKGDIAEKDVFAYVIVGATEAEKAMSAYNDKLREAASMAKELLGKSKKITNVDEIRAAEKALNHINKMTLDKMKLDAQRLKVQTQLDKATRLYNQENERGEKIEQKKAQAQQNLTSAYSRVNTWLQTLRKEYRDLAATQGITGKLDDAQIKRLDTLQKRIQQFDSTLKKVDAGMGLHTRNVGNYGLETNNLRFSFTQLAREAPAFANSFQTGFMAISNNLPMFFDEVQKTRKEIQNLVSQGQKAPSMFKALSGAILSGQVAASGLVTALTVLGPKIIDAFTGAERAELIQKMMNKAVEEGRKMVDEYVSSLERLRSWDKLTTGDAIQNVKDRIKGINDIKKQITEENKALEEQSFIQKYILAPIESNTHQARTKFNNSDIKKANEILDGLYAELEALKLEEYQDNKNAAAKKKKYDIELKTVDLIKYKIELMNAERALDEVLSGGRLEKVQEDLQKELELRLNAIRQRAESARFENSELDTLLQEQRDIRIKSLEDQFRDEKRIRDAELQSQINQTKEAYEEERKRIQEQYSDPNILMSKKERDALLKKSEETLQKELSLIRENANANEVLEIEKHEQEIIKINKETSEEQKKIIEQLNKVLEEFDDSNRAANKALAERVKAQFVKMLQEAKNYIDLSVEYFIKRSEDKIAQMDKEIAAAEKQQDYFRTLAEQGNITAQQSLAEQQRIIAEANRAREKEQRRIERLKLFETGLDIYTKKIEAGDKHPLINTIKDITLLRQALNALPAFYEGTETTVGAALGKPQLPGRDGHIVRVDGSEKILNPAMAAKTGNMTTGEISDVAYKYRTGQLVDLPKTDHAGNTYDLIPLLGGMKEVKKAIEAIPSNEYRIGEVTQTFAEIIHTTKRGNVTERRTHRILRK